MNLIRTTHSRLALALAVLFLGAFSAYAANPSAFSVGKVTHPNGIVATPAVFLVSSQDQPLDVVGPPAVYHTNIFKLDAVGNTLPGPGIAFVTISKATLPLQEVYLSAAPGVGGNWTAFDIYACRGNKVYKIPSGGGVVDGAAPFATLTGALDRQHCGIGFDRTGTFGFDLIVTTEGDGVGGTTGGKIFRVTQAGVVTLFKTLTYSAANATANVLEGPSVTTAGFLSAPGELLVTQEDNPGPPGTAGTVLHITPAGVVATLATFTEPESTHVIPPAVCDYTTTGGGFFTTDFFNNTIIKYPASDFVGLGGNVIVPIEFTSAGNNLKMLNKATPVVTSNFDAVATANLVHEGSAFVECGPALMPIVKHSTGATAPTNADFIFGLYPRINNTFANPPAGTPYSYAVNAADGLTSCAPTSPAFPGPSVRGTCILTPPENNLPIDLSSGNFNAAVCELKHTANWTFSSWTVGFTPNNLSGNVASAPFHPAGETNDAQIFCINLTIVPGTTRVDLDVFDSPPPAGGQYCSPGYWKQPQHFGSYPSNVNPLSTLFTSIFTTGPVHQYNGLTFPAVIATGGGGYSMLGRVCGASYLDAKTLNFGMSAADVVTKCNAAFAANDTGSQAFKNAVDQLGALAIENCPLGNAPLPGDGQHGQSGH